MNTGNNIPVSIHDAQPSPTRARVLRIAVSEALRKNLHAAVTTARKALPYEAEEAVHVVDSLDTHRRIAPKVFTLHWQLSAAMRRQNASQVAVALSELVRSAELKQLYADGFEISSLTWDTVDAATVEYLCNPGGPRGPQGELPEMRALQTLDFDQLITPAWEAMALLVQAHPLMYGEIQELVTNIRLYEPRFVGSMSSPRSFGVMYIYKPHDELSLSDPALFYLNHITHETSHIALNAVMTQGPLILNDPAERYSSPVRPDPRPMDGVYHAAFVLSRVALVQSQPVVMQRPAAAETQEGTLKAFWASYETVAEHGKLTDEGRQIIESCRKLVENL